MVYEIMGNKSNQIAMNNDNITFDYDGKIIQIKRPGELPNIIYGPDIKVKKAVVLGNYIKDALERAKKK